MQVRCGQKTHGGFRLHLRINIIIQNIFQIFQGLGVDVENISRNECDRTNCSLSMSQECRHLSDTTRAVTNGFAGLHLFVRMFTTKCKFSYFLMLADKYKKMKNINNPQKRKNNNISLKFCTYTAPAMPTQRAMQTVHRAEATGILGRSEHEPIVPMSTKSSLSQPSHGQWRFAGQKLH